MKVFRKSRRKLNNKGLSLVEVIIAVVVLAAVVAPTMRLFASAAGNNARSKDQQRAVAVAESAMESFKAYDMEALCLQFGQGSGGTPFKGVSYDGSTTYSVTATNSVGTAVAPILDSENKLNKGVANFKFLVKNAVEDGKYYDVEILVNKNTDKSVMEMDAANSYTDAVIQMRENDTNLISTLIAAQAEVNLATISSPSDMVAGGSLSVSNVTIDSVERNIKLTASVDGSGNTKIVQEIDYDFSLTYSYQYHSIASGVSSVKTITGQTYSGTLEHEFDDVTHAKELVVFDNTATGGKLKNINLYYFPMYKEVVGASSAKDIITIDCSGIPTSASDPINAHVIKQMATIPSKADLEIYESTYHVDVDNTGNLVLHNNLDKNLAPGASSSGSTVSVSGFLNAADLVTGTKENKGLLYNVEVKVYNAGETEVLATFSGTKNN